MLSKTMKPRGSALLGDGMQESASSRSLSRRSTVKVDKIADNEDDQDVVLSDEDLQEPQRAITEPLEDELMNA